MGTPIDNDLICQLGGASEYADGVVICWSFECICEYMGRCSECPINNGYWEACGGKEE